MNDNGKLIVPAGTPLIGQTLVDGPAEGGRQAPTAVGVQFNGGFVIAALCQADKDQLTRIEKMLELLTHASFSGVQTESPVRGQ